MDALLVLLVIGLVVWLAMKSKNTTGSSSQPAPNPSSEVGRNKPLDDGPRCERPGCVNAAGIECGSCVQRFCPSHGGWIPYGNEIDFLCDECWTRNQASDNPAKVKRYKTAKEASGDARRRNFPYREFTQYGSKCRVYELRCPHCGQTGTASFSYDEKSESWHNDALSDGFAHDEYSRGGAEVYCAHYGYARLVCDPNLTGNVDDVL